MEITASQITKYVVTGATNLDPVTILAEDFGPRQGQISIACYGKSWTAYFGGMGERTIKQFVCTASVDYLVTRFMDNAGQATSEPDMGDSQEKATKALLEERRKNLVTRDKARDLFDQIKSDWPDSLDHAFACRNELMTACFGEEWWRLIDSKDTADYKYLSSIVKTVQEALHLLEVQPVAAQ